MVGITATDRIWKKELKEEEEEKDSLRDLWDSVKCSNIHIIRASEGEKREKGPEKIVDNIIAENFPQMGK